MLGQVCLCVERPLSLPACRSGAEQRCGCRLGLDFGVGDLPALFDLSELAGFQPSQAKPGVGRVGYYTAFRRSGIVHIHGADAVRGAGGCVWLLMYCGAVLVSCWPVLGEVTVWVSSGGEGSVGVAWVGSKSTVMGLFYQVRGIHGHGMVWLHVILDACVFDSASASVVAMSRRNSASILPRL